MKEFNFVQTWLPEWQKENPGGRLFRNNTGIAWQSINKPGSKKMLSFWTIWKGLKALTLVLAKPIFFGIGLKNKKGHHVGGGDYIGWTEKTICEIIRKADDTFPCMENRNDNCEDCELNNKVAIFTSIEFKTSGVSESPDQIKFRKLVEKSGGITKVINVGEK